MKTTQHYSIVTLTHRHTPLKELGQFVLTPSNENYPEADLAEVLERLRVEFGVEELLYLATCNRILFVFVHAEPLADVAMWSREFLQRNYAHLPEQTLEKGCATAQFFEGEAAVQHLFEVASSIDSLVVGEREILRQLRTAYDEQAQWGTTGDAIRLLMRLTVETAKKVYSNTAIGEKPVSVVSLAMQKLFSHHVGKDARFLLVGAGQTNQLVAKFLVKHEVKNIAVFNRTASKAEALAQQISSTGKGYGLEALATYPEGFDVLIACTGATEAVVTPQIYAQLLAGDAGRKIAVDLSIPHNISDDTVTQFAIDYIEIEHLRLLAKENLAFREQEVDKARTLITEAVEQFAQIFRARQVELALSEVPRQIKAVTEHAINTLFSQEVAQLDTTSRATLDKIVAYLEKRCIAIPLQVARENLVGKI